ncbi:hypothetical protein SPH9361_04771 [Sphingobium sp. CECT 9361]|nr:hypothetical protein SPH9361_04771 [Sphingobium sp. CECT 9361]
MLSGPGNSLCRVKSIRYACFKPLDRQATVGPTHNILVREADALRASTSLLRQSCFSIRDKETALRSTPVRSQHQVSATGNGFGLTARGLAAASDFGIVVRFCFVSAVAFVLAGPLGRLVGAGFGTSVGEG